MTASTLPSVGSWHHARSDEGPWTPETRAAWQRIAAYDPDHLGDGLPFSARLARDNCWSGDHAQRALQEYRRFVFLALVCDHPVTPSDAVDQVWHLHLQYSREYWQHFCPDVLGREFHHGPTRGGPLQGALFDDQYARTRLAYRRWFGELPPADLWPGAGERFGRDTRWVRVNRDDSLLLPHPRRLWHGVKAWLSRRLRGGSMLLVPLLLAGVASAQNPDMRAQSMSEAGGNPYQLAAGPFLQFFAVTCAVVLVLAFASLVMRVRSRNQGLGLDASQPDLFSAAWLCGGRERVIGTAVATIVERGWGHVNTREGKLVVQDVEPGDAHPLVKALLRHASKSDLTARELFQSTPPLVQDRLQAIHADLVRAELLHERSPTSTVETVAVVAFPVAIALPRVLMALAHGRPFGYLVLLTILFVAFGVAITHTYWRHHRELTEGGHIWRKRLRARSVRDTIDGAQGEAALSGFSVFGASALAGTALVDLQAWHRSGKQDAAAAGGCGDAGGSVSGGSGCGGGGSGCGGGGCGG